MITDEQVERACIAYDLAVEWEGRSEVYRSIIRIKMRAALEAALPQWQPIETAPKGGPIWVGRWANRVDDGRRYWHSSKMDGSDLNPEHWTHWQPDQEPPPPGEGS